MKNRREPNTVPGGDRRQSRQSLRDTKRTSERISLCSKRALLIMPAGRSRLQFAAPSRAALRSKRPYVRFSHRCAVPSHPHERPLRGPSAGTPFAPIHGRPLHGRCCPNHRFGQCRKVSRRNAVTDEGKLLYAQFLSQKYPLASFYKNTQRGVQKGAPPRFVRTTKP